MRTPQHLGGKHGPGWTGPGPDLNWAARGLALGPGLGLGLPLGHRPRAPAPPRGRRCGAAWGPIAAGSSNGGAGPAPRQRATGPWPGRTLNRAGAAEVGSGDGVDGGEAAAAARPGQRECGPARRVGSGAAATLPGVSGQAAVNGGRYREDAPHSVSSLPSTPLCCFPHRGLYPLLLPGGAAGRGIS